MMKKRMMKKKKKKTKLQTQKQKIRSARQVLKAWLVKRLSLLRRSRLAVLQLVESSVYTIHHYEGHIPCLLPMSQLLRH